MSYNRNKNKSTKKWQEKEGGDQFELSISAIDNLVRIYDPNEILDRIDLYRAILPRFKWVFRNAFKENTLKNIAEYYAGYWNLRDKFPYILKEILKGADKQISKMPELTPAEMEMLKKEATKLRQGIYGKD